MGCPKLTLPLGTGLLVSPVLDLATAVSGANNVFVVLRPEAEPVLRAEVTTRGLQAVTAERAADGQAESLKAGILAMERALPNAVGVIVFLADQPHLKLETVQAVVREFDGGQFDGRQVVAHGVPVALAVPVAPAFEGRRGHPVILPKRAFAAVKTLHGDRGARELLQAFGLRLVASSDRAVLQDVDTPEAYAACVADWGMSKDLS